MKIGFTIHKTHKTNSISNKRIRVILNQPCFQKKYKVKLPSNNKQANTIAIIKEKHINLKKYKVSHPEYKF
jgi:hypothetical protein